jgi:hypothetical protein
MIDLELGIGEAFEVFLTVVIDEDLCGKIQVARARTRFAEMKEELAGLVQDLDIVKGSVHGIDPVIPVHGNAPRSREIGGRPPELSVGALQMAVPIEFQDLEPACIGNIEVAMPVEGDVRREREQLGAVSGLSEPGQDISGLAVKDDDLLVLHVGDVKPVLEGNGIHRSPALLTAECGHIEIVLVEQDDLFPDGIGNIFVPLGIYADVQRLRELSQALGSRQGAEGPALEIEDHDRAVRVADVDLAGMDGDAIGLIQPVLDLFCPGDELFEGGSLGPQVLLAG